MLLRALSNDIKTLSIILRICFTLFLLNFGVINHLVAIMVDRVSNISGESAVLHEKLLSKAHDSLIRGLEEDLRVGIGMDGKLSALAILADFPLKKGGPDG